jgi:hypothetical protein
MSKRRIFVFGSNLAGRHGKGAAKVALKQHGAVYGRGMGLQGNSYAIPTRDERIRTLPLYLVESEVDRFLHFARANPGLTFYVTRIGCGEAGYGNEDIGRMFAGAPNNCQFPVEWEPFIPHYEGQYTFYKWEGGPK